MLLSHMMAAQVAQYAVPFSAMKLYIAQKALSKMIGSLDLPQRHWCNVLSDCSNLTRGEVFELLEDFHANLRLPPLPH